MNVLRCFTCLVAAAVMTSQSVLAQEQPPLIVLDPAPANQVPEQSSTTAVESQPPSLGEAVPQIQLPSATMPSSETADPEASPLIPERDRGDEVRIAERQPWLAPLIPLVRLPDTVQIGASQAEPGILRLTGEVAFVDLQINLPQNAVIPAEMLLTLRSTVNVLPEVSEISITINEAAPVVLPLEHLNAFETVRVATTGLKSGANLVRLNVRQPHRIYCGPEASFGVWTDINLAQSGVPVDADIMAADHAGFALALRALAATGQPLPVLVGENENGAMLQQLVEVLGQISGGQVLVEFRSFYGLEAPSPLSVALIGSDRSHAEFRKGAAGGLVLQVEHADGILPPLDQFLPKLATPLDVVPALTPGATVKLADLGQQDIIGGTHYFRHEVPFDLPSDWLLLSNQKARLQLHYGFADALPAGSILLIKVNNETVRLLPLDRKGGQMQEPLDIVFAANLLHGRRNNLIFEMMVPGDPPDATCPLRRADMLVITSDSTLLVPPAPTMALAGLAEPLSRLGSRGITVPEGVSDRAALEMTAAQLSAGLTSNPETTDPSVRLNLISVNDISVLPLQGGLVAARDLQEALIDIKSASSPPGPAAAVEAAPRYRLTEEDPQPSVPLPLEPVANNSAVRDLISGRIDWLESAAFMGSDESLSTWLKTRHGSVLLLRPRRQEPDELWLVLGSQVSVPAVLQSLVRLREGGLAKGEAAILTKDNTWEVWAPVRPPELREPLKLSNLRAVLGNYASWSPLLFTVTFLVLALLSAIPALLFILFTKRRGQL
ncbi:cellulose biosynthesis cyclic di-GMP-binding regulatory protein BcsB [Paracoccus benzoatiresistens]|uniref:Cyclic di-GMP-binding protein n=1 Tax=Paracoccus benzoatiresistens TaxID=2997341 RepID=A0ABT4JAV2_9RHOB|nr:cellulose biosynthesis cyclic di-GMP-binding regulatory protein BcsB [Paracoccus sp. EF6]MCZ0964195.1 cellulose biosynthesis cyclic di-GMP-binding regulatory protein BcsB [Paracoccus sp. EF6]